MNAMPHRAAFTHMRGGPPTPLLRFIAGEFADALAHAWPAPHEGFFALPAARRHAAAILALGSTRDFVPALDQGMARRIACEKDGVLARRIAGEAAPGLMKALGKAGEPLWTAEAYRRLLDLFEEPLANRALRHMDEIRPATLAPLSALPAPLREAKVLAATPCVHAAEDLARAFHVVLRMKGEGARRPVIERWSRAKTTQVLFQMAAGELVPDAFTERVPAPDLPEPFARVRTRDQLVRVAMDFRNCLRDFMGDVANGRMVVFVWRGRPNAALALTWDAAGWRLAEAEAADNEPLEEVPLRAIVEAVEAAGVRTGPSLKTLQGRLETYANGHGHPQVIPNAFDEQLELGDLWA